jgi:hypothetical protein
MPGSVTSVVAVEVELESATEVDVEAGAVVETAAPSVVEVGSSVVHPATPTRATAAEPLPIVLMKARLVIMAFPFS